MMQLSREVVDFFQNQGCVVFSTIDANGYPHSSCKGIVKIVKNRVYLLDVYQGATFKNLIHNASSSITAFDEHKFSGYCLKGNAKILSGSDLNEEIKQAWDAKITSRVSRRILRNIKDEKSGAKHHEAYLPEPKNLIMLEVKEVADLKPRHLR